jgi:DNA-binding PadR family transcriptional regulator
VNDTAKSPEGYLPLTPTVFNILLALADGEKHGYGIMLEVEANTAGQMLMGPGTLYGSIKRMLKAGLIEETDERPDPELDDQRRRYYRLTGIGQRVLQLEAERLASQVRVARAKNLLTGWSSS